MKFTLKPASVAIALAASFAGGSAYGAGTFTEALIAGKPALDARYRFERVEQDNALKDANASTLRLRLGYKTGEYNGISGLLEFSTTQVIGAERYNSGPGGNGKTRYSVVADPKITRFNQFALGYNGIADTTATLGRQRIIFDNARFVGNVGFRQQEQTFDALRVVNKTLPDTTINYVFVDRVNRVFKDIDDKNVEHHLLNVAYAGLPFGTLTGYGYFLDFGRAAPSSSTQTVGLRFAGGQSLDGGTRLHYTAELARQQDHAKFPGSYRADYGFVELGATLRGVTAKLGHERLGSDRRAGKGFETRLATLHAHNGWADQFLVTPADGLRDTSLSVGTDVKGVQLLAVYRDYKADRGGNDYGSEWGLMARRAFGDHYALEFKAARYDAKDGPFVDTTKIWLTAEMKF
jgi:hypothetical protein